MSRVCPGCGATVAKAAREPGAILLAGKRFRLYADRLVYACPDCGHDIVVPLQVAAPPPQPKILARKGGKVPV